MFLVFLEKLRDLINIYPETWRSWIAKYLVIIISRPEDVETVLNNYVEKGPLKEWGRSFMKDSLVISPVDVWKKHRKIINPTFNLQILKTFPTVLEKHSKRLVKALEGDCGKDVEVYKKIWRCTLDMACDTLLDVDVEKLKEQNEQLSRLLEVENLLLLRGSKPWLFPESFWELSSLYKKVETVSSEMFEYVKKIIHMKKVELPKFMKNDIRKKVFLNHLLTLNSQSDYYLSNKAIVEETNLVMIAASETTAVTASFALLVLGLFPHIQQKVYDEIHAVFGNSTRNISWQHLTQMDYLERVIKETLRLFPPILFVMRELDQDHSIKSYILPAGSLALIPIYCIHKDPKYWDEPETFNPDRFKPENFERIPRGSYIPFSCGPRNCIGYTYGLMSIKVVLSTLLRSYKVSPPVDYASLEDIKCVFSVINKPKKNFRIKLVNRS